VPARGPAAELVDRQRNAAERLKREVAEVDGSLRHPYFRDYDRQLRAYRRHVERAELIDRCAAADVTYVGDYHAVARYQRFAAELLRELVPRVERLALGVEFVYTRQQRFLDRRQAGLSSDEALLRRIHYREEWGYPWEGLRELLDVARSAGVPVYALDAPPRGGFDGLIRRDRHAAAQIVSILNEDPGRRLLVLFGETHISRSHLPRKVQTRMRRRGREPRQVAIFQNPDRIWWQLVSGDRPLDATVEVDDDVYAVFHTSPLQKYEAYRQVLDRWRDDVPPDEEVDLSPAVHHLIGVLLGWLDIDPRRYRLHHRAGWDEPLEDAFPEVYSGPEATELLAPILEEYGRTPEEIVEARGRLERRRALYEPRSNTLFIEGYHPGCAAGEAARFLRTALTRRLFITPDDFRDRPEAATYGAAYDEALAHLGSRLVDPVGEYAGRGEPTPDASPVEIDTWLAAHREFEASSRYRMPVDLRRVLRESRPVRRAIARDLGGRLGRALFERVRRGALGGQRLRRLFSRPLRPEGAPRFVLRLVRGYRGTEDLRAIR
jgi:uncharacterized iron-regulated protein